MSSARLVVALYRAFMREAQHYKKTYTHLRLIVPVLASRWGVLPLPKICRQFVVSFDGVAWQARAQWWSASPLWPTFNHFGFQIYVISCQIASYPHWKLPVSRDQGFRFEPVPFCADLTWHQRCFRRYTARIQS